MGLIKIARSADELNNVPYVKKEIGSKVVVLLRRNNEIACYILNEDPAVLSDGSLAIPAYAAPTHIYNDGALWIDMPEEEKVAMGTIGSGYGLGNMMNLGQGYLHNMPPPPPPLVPFAGCDRKAMPPSPMAFKQAKAADASKQGSAISRKISFGDTRQGNDTRQAQISDFFKPQSMEF